MRHLGMTIPPSTRQTRRYAPDPILIHLTAATAGPPLCPEVRADIVRLAMAQFAYTRGYMRLACVFSLADEDVLKSLLLALQDQDPDSMLDLDPAYYAKSLRDASAAWRDETFIRLASVASDVLDWGGGGEWKTYVVPAWDVLCDEVEFEQEEREKDVFYEDEYYCVQLRKNQGYSKAEAQAQGLADARRWGLSRCKRDESFSGEDV